MKVEAPDPSPEARLATDKTYSQFWWRLMFEVGILAMVSLYFAFAGT